MLSKKKNNTYSRLLGVYTMNTKARFEDGFEKTDAYTVANVGVRTNVGSIESLFSLS